LTGAASGSQGVALTTLQDAGGLGRWARHGRIDTSRQSTLGGSGTRGTQRGRRGRSSLHGLGHGICRRIDAPAYATASHIQAHASGGSSASPEELHPLKALLSHLLCHVFFRDIHRPASNGRLLC